MKQWLYVFGQWLRRDANVRYKASILGTSWLLLQPILQILLFTLIFYKFFNIRWPQGSGSIQEYGLQVFTGLSIYTFFAESLNRSPTAILSQPYLVTKVKFPLTILSTVLVSTASIQMLLSISIILVLCFVTSIASGFSWLALPLLLAPIMIYMLAISFFFSSLSVYIKDLVHFAPAISSFALFLTPVFYPASMIPPDFSWLVTWSPLAWTIEVVRQAVFHDGLPSVLQWGTHCFVAAMMLIAAYAFFKRIEAGFPDAI